MWMNAGSYRDREGFARPICDLASPNGSATPTLALGWVVTRAAGEGGAGYVQVGHNYTLIAPPDFSGFAVSTGFGGTLEARGLLSPRQQ
ncbi:hypothetical protein ACVWXL_003742 [Bradyrhizobium sp. GM22.5]